MDRAELDEWRRSMGLCNNQAGREVYSVKLLEEILLALKEKRLAVEEPGVPEERCIDGKVVPDWYVDECRGRRD